METQEKQDPAEGDEDQQEFAEQVEEDPSTAQTGDEDDLEEVRGG